MTDDELATALAHLVKVSEGYRDQMSVQRQMAMDYYNGVMTDLVPRPNWSKAVSKDVHTAISKALPSVMRTFFSSEVLAEYLPAGQDDEEKSQQVTDYINVVVIPEAGVEVAVQDVCEDAMLLRNGVLKAWFDKRRKVAVSEHTGLDEMALAALVESDDIEVLEQTQVPSDLGPTWSVKIKRTTDDGRIRAAAVPLEEFLIHPDATCIEDSLLTGQWRKVPRSDLIAMGYDRDAVEALPVGGNSRVVDGEALSRRRDEAPINDDRGETKSNELLDYYELFARLDYDDDGIAEMRRVCMAGGLGVENILENEYADEDDVPYYDIVSKRRPHQWEGHSLADEVIEIQRIKTALLRSVLDNIYWQNALQPVVNAEEILNPDAVMQPEFGRPIMMKGARPVSEVLQWRQVPFVGEKAMEMLAYWDTQVKDRTGITDASAGLAPDALQNVTAKATAMIEQSGVNHVEMMTRTLARSLKRFFKGLLKLVIKHQDKVRTVRLRNDWVDIDPRQWNAGMDVVINTGLGAGTRERDMMMMQVVLAVHEKIIAGMGPDNPLVSLDNIYHAVEKLIMAAGLKGVNSFITKPAPEEAQAYMEKIRNRPDPEMVKAQAAMALEKQKTEAQIMREKAQMEADQVIKKQETDDTFAIENLKAQNTLMIEREKIAMEREKMQTEHGLRKEEMGVKGEHEMFRAKLQGERVEGKGVTASKEHTDKIDKLADMLATFLKAQTARKRLIKNPETGDIEGVEPVYDEAA